MHAAVDTRHAYVMDEATCHSMYIPTCLEFRHSLSCMLLFKFVATDINECSAVPCGTERCSNTEGSYFCFCERVGYTWNGTACAGICIFVYVVTIVTEE